MRNFFATLSLGKTPDAGLNLSLAIGSTVVRQVVASGLYFVAMWITTRQLGPQQNGVLATLLLLPQTLYAFLNLGLGASHVYQLSSGTGHHARMRRLNWALAASLWAAVVGVLALSSAASIARYLPGIAKPAALLASILFPVMLLAAWTSALIQGSRDYRTYNKTLLVQPLTFCCGVALLWSLHRVTVLAVLGCYIASQGALWLLSEATVQRYRAVVTGRVSTLGEGLRFGLRAHLSNVITFLNYRIALYLVSFLRGPTTTGRYALAVQLAEALWLISGAASLIVFPESAAHSKSPAQLQQMVARIAGTVVRITLAGAIVVGLAAPLAIPAIFGEAYRDSVMPFVILLPGIVAWSYMSIISNSLAGMAYQRINILSALLCLTINIAGDLFAIPRFGANGAALASTLAFSLTTAYSVWMYRRIMREKLRAMVTADSGKRANKMLIVTSAFPYEKGEAFVQAELAVLAQRFDDIALVPCFGASGGVARAVDQPIDTEYAAMRWGPLRAFTVARCLVSALLRYRWRDDAARIVRGGQRVENVKELMRALYRARLFEMFLERCARRDGGAVGLVYFYWMVPEIMGALAYRSARAPALKIVARAHGGDLYEDRKRGGYAGLRAAIVDGIDGIYCISRHGKRYLDAEFPAMAAKFHVARLGVADPLWLNAQPQQPDLSIVSCSFVVPGKRLHLIVDAIAWLLERQPHLRIRWTHIGDGELAQALRAHVAQRLAGRAEVVLTGYLTQQEIDSLYRSTPFDAIVNVSACEGIPVSLMEASAFGIPMVATDVGGSGEIVNAGNGVLIAADADVATIAAALWRFADRDAAMALRRAARRDWHAHFNAAANYAAFGDALLRLRDGSAAPPPVARAQVRHA